MDTGKRSRHFFQILMKLEFSGQSFQKYSDVRFRGNTSSKSRADPCRQTAGQTGMTKLIAALCNFAGVPKRNDDNLDRMWKEVTVTYFNPYPTAFPYGNGMVLHFYQQQESSTTKTVHEVINKGLKAYV